MIIYKRNDYMDGNVFDRKIGKFVCDEYDDFEYVGYGRGQIYTNNITPDPLINSKPPQNQEDQKVTNKKLLEKIELQNKQIDILRTQLQETLILVRQISEQVQNNKSGLN